MIYTTTCPAAVLPIEEAPPRLAGLFREWLDAPDLRSRARVDFELRVALWGRRGVRLLCDDWIFWLAKEDDRTDVVRTMARSIDLPGRGDGR